MGKFVVPLGFSIALAIIFVVRFLHSCWDCDAEMQEKNGIAILLCIVLCIAIGWLGWSTTEHCPNCKAVVTSAYCEQCGEQMDISTCPGCGAECDTPYCGECGTPMVQEG